MFKYYVLNYNFNKGCIEQFNIFNNWVLDEEVQKQVRRYLRAPSKYKFEKDGVTLYGFDALCEDINRDIRWQEWSRYEYEISVGKPFKQDNNKLEKWDCYDQCEKNIPMITREVVYQYKQHLKENKNEDN